jgi:hypothetical protein
LRFSLSSCSLISPTVPSSWRGQLVVRVGAQVARVDVDALELVLALEQVGHDRPRHVGADRHRGVRQLGQRLDHAPVDRLGLHPQHLPEALEALAQRLVGDRRQRHRLAALALGPPGACGHRLAPTPPPT